MGQKQKFKQTEIEMIPKDWELTIAKDFCERVTDGTHDSPKKKKIGKFLITSRHLKNNSLDFDNAYFISEEDFVEVNKRSIVNQFDILFSMIGTVGETYQEKSNKIDYAIKNVGLFKFGGNKDKSNWFLYWVKSTPSKHYIETRQAGSTQQYLTLDALRRFPIAFPKNKQEQKAIAKIFLDLDSKIELLQKQNETLETIGQTIFKHWFVDFEFPNEKGKPYKSSGGKMVESELGEIPEGWKVGEYDNLVMISTGKGLKKSEYVNNGIYSIIGANGELGKTNKFLFDEPLILTGRVGTLGTIFLIDYKVWISDNVLISKPKKKENYFYSYFVLNRLDLKSLNRGSTQPLITQTDLKKQRVIIPLPEVLILFDKQISNLFNKISLNNENIQSLQKTRDLLLPKLMSGKIRVPLEVRA